MPNRENEGIRPGNKGAAIIPSDMNPLGYITKAIYVGVTGDITLIPAGQTATVLYKNCQAGSKIVVAAKHVKNAGTTPNMGLVADYDDYPTKGVNP